MPTVPEPPDNRIDQDRGFRPGEIVNVQIRGVRYVRQEPDGAVTVQTEDPAEHLWVLPPQAAVERVAPKEWPPQAGDIWEDRNRNEWAGLLWNGDVKLYLVTHDGSTREWPDSVAGEVGPMRLVRRRGWTPEPPTAEEQAAVDLRAARVAGLRAFADLLETRTDVPLPYSINGQAGFRGEEGLADALRIAASLGVEMEPIHDTGHEVQRWATSAKLDFGADVTLTLYAYGLDAPSDCCPDAAPDPDEVGGESVEDTGAES